MSKWFEILKPGTFKDTAGRDHTFTMDRLKEIERKFNEQTNEAPLVVGHPEMNSPAFGWAQKLKLVGDRLKALPHQIVPEFAEAVNKGIYKYVSVSLRPDDSLRHIGFLGGMPPAVKGLAPVMFAEEPEITIDFANGELDLADGFANNKIRALGGIIQRIRDWLIQKDGVEAADKIIGQWEVDWLKEDSPPGKEAVVAAPGGFSEAQTTPVRGKEDTKMEVKKTETPAAAGVLIQTAPIGEFAERVATLETQNAKLLEDNKKLQREKIESSVRNFVEGLAGKILPKHKRAVTEILMSLQEGGLEINFSEGPEKKPAAQLMRDFLEELPAQIPTKPAADGATGKDETSGEFSEVETDPERLDLHNRAKALEAKEKIPYAEAVSRLMKGGK